MATERLAQAANSSASIFLMAFGAVLIAIAVITQIRFDTYQLSHLRTGEFIALLASGVLLLLIGGGVQLSRRDRDAKRSVTTLSGCRLAPIGNCRSRPSGRTSCSRRRSHRIPARQVTAATKSARKTSSEPRRCAQDLAPDRPAAGSERTGHSRHAGDDRFRGSGGALRTSAWRRLDRADRRRRAMCLPPRQPSACPGPGQCSGINSFTRRECSRCDAATPCVASKRAPESASDELPHLPCRAGSTPTTNRQHAPSSIATECWAPETPGKPSMPSYSISLCDTTPPRPARARTA